MAPEAPAAQGPPPALAATGVEVTVATPADHVDGVGARWVARPAGTDEVAALLKCCAANGFASVARGSGTKLRWGAPPRRADVIVDLGRMSAVLDHAAGDLVVEVEAGCRLSTLRATLARYGQQLAVDGDDDATVGGIIATAASGPRRQAYGTVRDLLIGITFVRADGTVASAGGRVVKNVAGYDLCKLFVGSYGTLGVITRAVFRLHPLPAAQAQLRVEVPEDGLAAAAAALVHSQLVPATIEVSASADGPPRLSASFQGSRSAVAARLGAATELLTRQGIPAPDVVAPADWAYPWPDGGTGIKFTCTLSRVADTVALVRRLGRELDLPYRLTASAGVGVGYVGLPGSAAPEGVSALLAALRRQLPPGEGSAVVLCAPPRVRAAVDAWGPVPAIALMSRVKDEFDPHGLLSPGRFVGGI